MPYPWFGVIINIVSKEANTYRITIGNIPQYTCPNFTKMLSGALGRKKKQMYYKHLYYVFKFLCKVENDKFIHVPTFTYYKVMHLLKLVGVIAHQFLCSQVFILVSINVIMRQYMIFLW